MTSTSSPVDSIAKAMEGVQMHRTRHKISEMAGWSEWSRWEEGFGKTDDPTFEIEIENRLFYPTSDAAARQAEAMKREMAALLNTEALSGIRALVAGWNGEHLPENERFGRHHDELGVKLPTTCGAIYALDEAMIRARALIGGGNAEN